MSPWVSYFALEVCNVRGELDMGGAEGADGDVVLSEICTLERRSSMGG